MVSICKPCKCSFVLITVQEVLPLSVLVIKLEMTTLLSGKVFSIDFFRSSNLPGTTLDGSLTVLLVPTYIILSGHFFNSGLILSYMSSIVAPGKFFNARQHWITNYDSGISTPFLKIFIRLGGFLICANLSCCFWRNSISWFPFVFTDLFSFRCSSHCVWFSVIWSKVFKNGPSKICGRRTLKNLKVYGLLKQTMSF